MHLDSTVNFSHPILTPYFSLWNLKVDIALSVHDHSPNLSDSNLEMILRGVVALIQHCPKLESFSPVFDTTKRIFIDGDGRMVRNKRIREAIPRSCHLAGCDISSAGVYCQSCESLHTSDSGIRLIGGKQWPHCTVHRLFIATLQTY